MTLDPPLALSKVDPKALKLVFHKAFKVFLATSIRYLSILYLFVNGIFECEAIELDWWLSTGKVAQVASTKQTFFFVFKDHLKMLRVMILSGQQWWKLLVFLDVPKYTKHLPTTEPFPWNWKLQGQLWTLEISLL